MSFIESYDSELLDRAVNELSRLPGIGRKTALRLALSLLRRDEEEAYALGESIINLRKNVKYCRKCHNICDAEECKICSDKRRDAHTICVVENVNDVLIIESTGVYRGLYHVLGGVISPLDGVGPADLEIDSLLERISEEDISEVILGLSPTIEGDSTNYYLYRKLSESGVKLTLPSRGIGVGNDLQTTDELTLGRSLQNRIPYSDTLKT